MHDVLPGSGGHQARRQGDCGCAAFGEDGGDGMNALKGIRPLKGIPPEVEQELERSNSSPSRRDFFKKAGMFAVTFSAAGAVGSFVPEAKAQTAAAASAGPY